MSHINKLFSNNIGKYELIADDSEDNEYTISISTSPVTTCVMQLLPHFFLPIFFSFFFFFAPRATAP